MWFLQDHDNAILPLQGDNLCITLTLHQNLLVPGTHYLEVSLYSEIAHNVTRWYMYIHSYVLLQCCSQLNTYQEPVYNHQTGVCTTFLYT